jgi:hypothetical protein
VYPDTLSVRFAAGVFDREVLDPEVERGELVRVELLLLDRLRAGAIGARLRIRIKKNEQMWRILNSLLTQIHTTLSDSCRATP